MSEPLQAGRGESPAIERWGISSTFVRVYAAVLLALLLIFGAAQLALWLLDSTRQQMLWQQRFDPHTSTALVTLIDSLPASAPQQPVEFGPGLQYQWSLSAEVDSFAHHRLKMGGTVVEFLPDYVRVLLPATSTSSPGSSIRLLEFHFSRSGDYWQQMSLLLQSLLSSGVSATGLVKAFDHSGGSFEVLPSVAESPNTYLMSAIDGQRLLLKPYPVSSLAWLDSLLVAVFSALCLGVLIYLLVRQLEGGLKNLNQVTGRLAQGHLSARVSVSGHDAVAGLGCSINKMADHIQRLIGIQREMLRAVSHELRTPVARLRFGLQIMEDDAEDPYLGKQLRGMDNDLQELDQLIDEILTYARLEEGGPLLEFQLVDVQDIAEQVVEETAPSALVEVGFVASASRDTRGEVEPRYIHRAIQNLVGNACRYAGSRVSVVCSFTEDTCRVDVEDDGPGIPEEQWATVFDAFARLDDSRTRSSGGYGLGLSIVRRITYWHGGRAIVGRSDSLGGARFSLVWPRRHSE